MSLVQG